MLVVPDMPYEQQSLLGIEWVWKELPAMLLFVPKGQTRMFKYSMTVFCTHECNIVRKLHINKKVEGRNIFVETNVVVICWL